jgi:hypothetical protein
VLPSITTAKDPRKRPSPSDLQARAPTIVFDVV